MFKQKSSIDFESLTKFFAGSRLLSSKTIFDAMDSSDLSDVIFFIIFHSKLVSEPMDQNFNQKSDDNMQMFWNRGDNAVELKEALYHYNKALMHAQKISNSIEDTYCKRFILLYKWKAYTACFIDMELLANDRNETARRLKEKATRSFIHNHFLNRVFMERMRHEGTEKIKEYYDFNVERNSQIPCTSTDIEVRGDSQNFKVVATKDISIGTVLALETAYVALTSEENRYYSCYYCLKLNLNLIPCDDCVFVMFCDDNCKKLCFDEYHKFEHYLLPMIPTDKTHDIISLRIALKAALKLKSKCTWDEFIKESYNYGNNRIKESSVEEIYDVNYKFSPLTFKDDDPFVCSKMYKVSSLVAFLVISLDNNNVSFYPSEKHKKLLAIRAFSRVFMYFILYSTVIDMPMTTRPGPLSITISFESANSGLFSFSGKLKQVHLSNVIPVPVANKVALVTIRRIKKGDEITTPFNNHWTENLNAPLSEEGIHMYKKTMCNNCILCSEKSKPGLTLSEKKQLDYLNLENISEDYKEIFNNHRKYCKALTILNNKPYTAEYLDVYCNFKRSLLKLLDIYWVIEYLKRF